jgi:hypothetical protein
MNFATFKSQELFWRVFTQHPKFIFFIQLYFIANNLSAKEYNDRLPDLFYENYEKYSDERRMLSIADMKNILADELFVIFDILNPMEDLDEPLDYGEIAKNAIQTPEAESYLLKHFDKDKHAFRVCQSLLKEYLKGDNLSKVPKELQQMHLKYLNKDIKCPRKGSNYNPSAFLKITELVWAFNRFLRLDITRNDETKEHNSSCDLVCKYIKGIQYDSIKKIWYEFSDTCKIYDLTIKCYIDDKIKHIK